MTKALLVSGEGVYADTWHDFARTSDAIADVLRERDDLTTTVSTDVEGALELLDDVDLLVVNVGRSEVLDEAARPGSAIARSLDAFLAAGGAVWAHHVSSTAMPELPAWERAIGGRWERGRTFHPPIGPAQVRVSAAPHPITEGAPALFEVWDERYTDLVRHPETTELLSHEHDGASHPLLWVSDAAGTRAAYDALGHTVESYRHPARVGLLRRTRDWLVDG